MSDTALAGSSASLSVSLSERPGRCWALAAHDLLRGPGHDNCVLPHEIRPLNPPLTSAGEICTVSGHMSPEGGVRCHILAGKEAYLRYGKF